MARSRGKHQLEMNFDGLTDSVTNLVGALILLVVLLLGLTKEVTEARPVIEPGNSAEGSQSVEGLLREVERLQIQIAVTERQIAGAERRVQTLRAKAQQVLQHAGSGTKLAGL